MVTSETQRNRNTMHFASQLQRVVVPVGCWVRFTCVQKHTVRRQSKTSILSTNVDQTRYKQSFTGDKWQSKTLFKAIFDPRSLIVKSILDCRLPGVGNG